MAWKREHHKSIPLLGLASLCAIVLVVIPPCNSKPYAEHLSERSYIRQGDINIGGLFPVFAYNPSDQSCYKPDSLRLSDVKRVEAMAYAINTVNNDPNLLPNITLGFEIRDTCTNVAVALEESLKFVSSPLSGMCCAGDSCSSNKTGILAGVVGATRSSSSTQAAILFGLHHLPQISYLSTSDELSDNKTYPYFLRTVGADMFQVQAMIDIILQYKWDYISFLNSDDSYGKFAQQKFTTLAAENNICVGITRTISLTSKTEDYDDVMKELLDLQDVSQGTVVIVFGQLEMVKGILNATNRAGATRRFIWIGSDGWASNGQEAIQGYEEEAVGKYLVCFILFLKMFNYK